MAKIRGHTLEKVAHEDMKEAVLRITRDVSVHVEQGDNSRDVIKAFQDALGQILPFVTNGKRGRDGRASATIVIAPIFGELKNEVARTLASRITIGAASTWHQFELAVNAMAPASITATVRTPFPGYPIWPVHKSGSQVVLFDGGSDLGI